MTTLILFGAINYFLFGVFSCVRYQRGSAFHFYFALALFSLGSVMIPVVYARGLGEGLQWMWSLPILSFAIAPSFYLYIKGLTQQKSTNKLLHFVPVAVHLIYQYAMKYLSRNESGFFPGHSTLNIIGIVIGLCLMFQFVYYILQIRKVVQLNMQNIKQHYSNLDGKQLRWVKVLFASMLGLIGLWMLTQFTSWTLDIPIKSLPLVFIGLWLLSYYLFAIALFQEKILTSDPEPGLEPKESHNNYEELWKELNEAMRIHEYFLDEALSLQMLSKIMSVPSRQLSECINLNGQVNFHTFVNSFRVERVKKEMLDARNSHLTLLGIAFMAGFKSKSSFNQVFKDSTGFTPKQFILQSQ